ncbi:phospholipase D/nuclease [Hortaea werneckii]|uniref:PLD phosphodiesterase domain-containing protein n=1 Tax=Hortaea werneckii TaxID=91943 RepID=A0A3M7I5T8_HORWE|nr:phospholipase D/nuclease [Hortaea werneckii]KAI6980571.1 phospholipase D/nuclease [Hortaea werneckii]KAI7038045.1 phospholipase D/nuclease [Hortaea werneckii]KAI7066960.1 phospholipase D/nuclease [Hortaea werneckii]KAI7124315.1 phospholipase D/nuclease [Hortaea werneckii]
MASDSEDEDVKKAIALSLESSNTAQDALPAQEAVQTTITNEAAPLSSASITGLAGLDRRAMEQERLARQKARTAGMKRERSISPRELSDARKAPKIEETTFDLPSGARLNFLSTTINEQQASRKSASANLATNCHKSLPSAIKAEEGNDTIKQESPSPSKPAPPGSLQYPHGVVKKTWAFGHPRHNDIKLEEVLEPQTLRTAVLSAFQWDTDWVLSKLKTPLKGGRTKCVFIMQAKQESERKEIQAQAASIRSFLRLVFPPMEGQTWCMHSKLMLLFHPEKLRIAVPTANLLNFDWGETGSMENTVFLIDLPRLPDGKKTQVKDLTHFAQELLYFVQKQGVDEDVRDGLLNFDFAATEHMAFVHSVGGISYRDDARRTGFLGLGNAVRHLGLQTDRLDLDFAASSIGSLNDSQLQNLYTAAKGLDVTSPSSSSQPKPDFFQNPRTTGTAKPSPSPLPSDVRKNLRVYFPTHETVTSSSAGAAGTICLNRKYFENLGFPRDCFRDYISRRRGLLSHNKLLLARGKRRIGSGDARGRVGGVEGGGGSKDVAWVYVGSANCSQSAWGNLTVDRKAQKEKGQGGGWKMNCRNWECGVLLPVPPQNFPQMTVEKKEEEGEGDGIEVKKEDPDETDSEPESSSTPDPRYPLQGKGDTDQEQLIGMEVFNGLVDLPFVFPAPEYGGREPWYFQEWQTR